MNVKLQTNIYIYIAYIKQTKNNCFKIFHLFQAKIYPATAAIVSPTVNLLPDDVLAASHLVLSSLKVNVVSLQALQVVASTHVLQLATHSLQVLAVVSANNPLSATQVKQFVAAVPSHVAHDASQAPQVPSLCVSEPTTATVAAGQAAFKTHVLAVASKYELFASVDASLALHFVHSVGVAYTQSWHTTAGVVAVH